MKKALVIIDMLNDFYDGPLANVANVDPIIPNLQRLLEHARQSDDWVIVYSNDLHDESDMELSIWGPHAMRGTEGAEVIEAIAPIYKTDKEFESPKHFYGAFDNTGLEGQLSELGVGTVVLTGQHTNCCVRHSAYGAFRLGFEIIVPKDAVAVPPGGDQDEAIGYLKAIYGAAIVLTDDLVSAEVTV